MHPVKEKSIPLINKLGLHARASAKLVSTAARFESQLWISKERNRINGKSIMAVMTLGAPVGTLLHFECKGEDEEALLAALEDLIHRRVDEDE